MMGRNILVILFSALLLNASTEFQQLLKFPLLIQHYLQHKQKDSSLSFLEFVKLHYAAKDHPNDNDDNEDSKLPFKSGGDISHIDTPVLEKRVETGEIIHLQKTTTTYYSERIPNHRSIAIFHPPRIE